MVSPFAVRNVKKKDDKGVSKAMKNNKKKLNMEFMTELTKLEITEFLGVARILKVSVLREDETPRDFVEVFEDIVKGYNEASRDRRRELLKIIKTANKRK